MAVPHFTSSDTYLEDEPAAIERHEIVVDEYVEGTYDTLRAGPDGDVIAWFTSSGQTGIAGWEVPHVGRFSDWAIHV